MSARTEIVVPAFDYTEVEGIGWNVVRTPAPLLGYDVPISTILEDNSIKEDFFMHGALLEITITKEKLLTRLKTNREKHAKVYEEAVAGFHDACLKMLEETKEALLKRKVPAAIALHLPVPVDHTKDYDRLIEMIELSSDTEFDLNEQQAANYIMDEWHWTNQWLSSNAGYSDTAAMMMSERT